MPFTPSTAAQNTATLAGSNEANLASPLPALQTSITGGNLGPAAYIDALLSALGTQLESNNPLGNNTATGSFNDVPGSSITFTAPIAKSYTVHCDFSASFSVGGYGFARLVVNGDDGPGIIIHQLTTSVHVAVHLMHSANCAAGANTIKVQWYAVAGTMNTTSTIDYANYIVSGS